MTSMMMMMMEQKKDRWKWREILLQCISAAPPLKLLCPILFHRQCGAFYCFNYCAPSSSHFYSRPVHILTFNPWQCFCSAHPITVASVSFHSTIDSISLPEGLPHLSPTNYCGPRLLRYTTLSPNYIVCSSSRCARNRYNLFYLQWYSPSRTSISFQSCHGGGT